MKHLPALLAALSLATLPACASFSPGTLHMGEGKALIAAESALDAAVIAADTAVNAHLTTKAQNAKIAALAPSVAVALATARAAYKAGDAASYASATASLTALTTALVATH